MRHGCTSATIVLLAILTAAEPSRASDAATIAAARASIQHGFNNGKVAEMLAGRAQLAALSAAEPRSLTLHLWVAYADWRTVSLLARTDKTQAEKLDQDGIDHCDQALAIDAKSADALALKGGLQGMMISFRPRDVMSLGPDSEANLQRAQALDPKNPRVWFLLGLGAYNKPVSFGGGPDKAVEKLARARELYATAGADSGAFDFGRDDAWIWSGRAAVALHDYAGAQAMYRKALEINPGSGWVRHSLLPEADSLAARADTSHAGGGQR